MIILFISLLALSAFFSGAEIAYFSLTHAQARHMRDQGKKNADLVWKLKQDPQRLLITILIGNNVVNVFTSALATVLATEKFGSAGVGLATGVVTLLILVFGEITPKSLAQKNNRKLTRVLAPVLYILTIVLYPISWLLIHFNDFVAHKLFRTKTSAMVSEEEIRTLSRLGVESGVIDYREHQMIENIFRFDDTPVGDIMTPRYKMVTLNGDVSVAQIAYFVGKEGYSRYPVYDGDEDDIIGYVHANDILQHLQSDDRDFLLKNIVRTIKSVHEKTSIERLLRLFVSAQEHIVLVTRENNPQEIIGMVTLEDVLEELVGEIVDETDA